MAANKRFLFPGRRGCGRVDDSLESDGWLLGLRRRGLRVVELYPLEFEKEQAVADLGAALLYVLEERAVARRRGVRREDQVGAHGADRIQSETQEQYWHHEGSPSDANAPDEGSNCQSNHRQQACK